MYRRLYAMYIPPVAVNCITVLVYLTHDAYLRWW